MMFEPCFRVQKTDTRSFRGSLAALSFAYCDFTQHNPRTQLTSNDPMMREQAAAVAMPRASAIQRAPVTTVTVAPARPIATSSGASGQGTSPVTATPVSTSLRPAIEE
jgi:hypothetical protein